MKKTLDKIIYTATLTTRSAKSESPDTAFLADRPCSGLLYAPTRNLEISGEVVVKIRCPRCKSGNHYIKESIMKHFCRTCGFLWDIVVDASVDPLDKITQVN